MSLMWTRRLWLLSSFGALASACTFSRRGSHALAEIESRVGGRVGVYALDTSNGRAISYRADERFAMCSTFKLTLVAAVLARADGAKLSLEQRLPYGSTDLLVNAPITSEHVAQGSMTIADLAHAAITVSDNTAANLLLANIGGPAGYTQFVRSIGDPVTRLDRNELALNDNEPGDLRDTTSPRAMVGLMRAILCGNVLSPKSREQLVVWLRESETGKYRLRAGLPSNWIVGDKTGTGLRNAVNDIAIAEPPGCEPILIAAYMSEGRAELDDLQAAHAEIGRVVARELA